MTFIINIIRRPAVLLRDYTNLYPYCGVKLSKHYQNRKYSEWVHRRPSAIVNEDELNTTVDNERPNLLRRKRIRRKSDLSNVVKESHKIKSAGTKGHQIIPASERVINQIMLQAKSRLKREKANSVIIEGQNFIKDSIEAGVKLRKLLFSKKSSYLLDQLNLPDDVELYEIPYKTVQTWSTLSTAPGIIGVFDAPDLSKTEPASDALPLTVICDNISDPRNLGSIIRSVAAVGCKKLILMKGCVDVWTPNAQRAAASAQFRLPIEMYPTWDEVDDLIDPDAQIYIADNHTYSLFNRVNGVDEVELQEKIESSKSMSDNENENDCKDSPTEDNDVGTSKRNKITAKEKMREMENHRKLRREFRKFLSQLPIQIFYMPNYTCNEVVLVVGGETQSFNLSLQKFLRGKTAERLHVPLCNNINSLNSGTTVGIIVYEIRRQYLMQQLRA